MDDIPVEHLYPQICVNCGAWLRKYSGQPPFLCDECGFDNETYLNLYRMCAGLDRKLEDRDCSALANLKGAWQSPLNYGWLPDLLAMLSACVLGLLTGASTQAIKQWLLKREAEFKRKYSPWWVNYERLVEVVLDYVVYHADDIKQITLAPDDVAHDFRARTGQLRKQIEPTPFEHPED